VIVYNESIRFPVSDRVLYIALVNCNWVFSGVVSPCETYRPFDIQKIAHILWNRKTLRENSLSASLLYGKEMFMLMYHAMKM